MRGMLTSGLILLAFAGHSAQAQRVIGRVIDAQSQQPVAGAAIALLIGEDAVAGAAMSDDSGRFDIKARAKGTYTLHIERIGYMTADLGPIDVPADSVTVQVRLSADAVPVDALVIEGKAAAAREPWLERSGYYDRKKLGFGRFIESAAIRSRSPLLITEMLQEVQGVRIHRVRGVSDIKFRNATALSSFGGRASMCYPPIFLDGQLISHPKPSEERGIEDRYDLDSLKPQDIEAIETYMGAAQVPPQYNVGGMAACGVVLFWTKK